MIINRTSPSATNAPRPSSRAPRVEIERTQLGEVLAELYGLLERYAPQWYSLEQHEKAESALRALRSRC